MAKIYFITHPNVNVDLSNREITQWDLSEEGLARLNKLLQQPWLKSIKSVFSSKERKATTAALKIAQKLGLEVRYIDKLGEMDRSATGPLSPEQFKLAVDEFFGSPTLSTRGWETAINAQERIVSAVDRVIREAPPGDIAIVAHGGVGALLLSKLKNLPISRKEEQPGQGYYFIFDRDNQSLIQDWKTIDDI